MSGTLTQGLCIVCRETPSTKRACACGLCGATLCKKCAVFLQQDSFALLDPPTPQLEHSHYCPDCFEREVEPRKNEYETQLEAAKEVLIFSRPVQTLRKSSRKISVSDCTDKKEAKLKMALSAVIQGFNALTEFKLTSEKVRNHGWQTLRWQGSAVPALVDQSRFDRAFLTED